MQTKRKVPLETCPHLDCARSGKCRAPLPGLGCRKYYMTADERRIEIAEKLEAFHAEFLADNPGWVPPEMSEEDIRYELRKAVSEVAIEMGISGAASRMPPPNTYTTKELQRFREGRAPKQKAETPSLDPPEGTS